MTRVLVLFFSIFTACGGSAGTLAKREPDEYAGCATDENWPLFDEATDVIDDSRAPLVITPGDGSTSPRTPVDVDWQVTPSDVGSEQGDIATSCAQWSTGYTTLHLPPVSGTVYDLQLVEGVRVVHRVLTSLQKWTASADTWSRLSGMDVQVRVTRITIDDNDRTSGPFAPSSSPRTTISP